MIIRPSDAIHKSYLNRVLTDICDDRLLTQHLVFKGGTCAAMLGYLDRFSVDLDFDCFALNQLENVRQALKSIFLSHQLVIKKAFDQAIMYELSYSNPHQGRSTMKVSVNTIPSLKDEVEIQFLPEINRYFPCQTISTMFANKLVAIKGRHDKRHTVAGRDLYDIHHFFLQGYKYSIPVIENRTQHAIGQYLQLLTKFIPTHFTQITIDQDLNHLLDPGEFRSIRKIIIPETVELIKQEIAKLAADPRHNS